MKEYFVKWQANNKEEFPMPFLFCFCTGVVSVSSDLCWYKFWCFQTIVFVSRFHISQYPPTPDDISWIYWKIQQVVLVQTNLPVRYSLFSISKYFNTSHKLLLWIFSLPIYCPVCRTWSHKEYFCLFISNSGIS